MERTVIGCLVGILDVEAGTSGVNEYYGDHDGAHPTAYRPRRIHLENDGKWWFWLDPGIGGTGGYTLHWDSTGWRVTCYLDWNHTYRLASSVAGFAEALPLEGNDRHVLDRDHQYRIVLDAGRWKLRQV